MIKARYFVEIMESNEIGAGNFTEPHLFTTELSIPDVPLSPEVGQLNATLVSIILNMDQFFLKILFDFPLQFLGWSLTMGPVKLQNMFCKFPQMNQMCNYWYFFSSFDNVYLAVC